jgi:hypothetical protein
MIPKFDVISGEIDLTEFAFLMLQVVLVTRVPTTTESSTFLIPNGRISRF